MTATAHISISDPAELRSLREHLDRAPGVDVHQVPAATASGELGVWDFLQVAAASGGTLVVAIKTLPEFIRSRRTDVTVTLTLTSDGNKTIAITTANAQDALRLVEKALDA